jgi:DNA repair protein RAD57
MLDNIQTTRCNDVDALDHALSYVLPALLSSPAKLPCRLLVLDSIGALFRAGDHKSSYNGIIQRTRALCPIADKLKALAAQYNIAVLVINQVADVREKEKSSVPHTQLSESSASWTSPAARVAAGEPLMLYATQAWWFSGITSEQAKEAALGLVWANAINVRVMVSRTGRRRLIPPDSLKRKRSPEGDEEQMNQPTLIRRFRVVFSAFAPPSTTDFIITTTGVHSIPGKTEPVNETNDSGLSEAEYARGDDVFDDLGELGDEFWGTVAAVETQA